MNYNYIVVSNTYYFSDKPLTFYGIAAIKECDEHREIIDAAFDLSSDMDKIYQAVKLCNEQKLDIIHLRDVAEDFINA